MRKFDFDNYTFYINNRRDGVISGETVGVSKFYNNFLQWNRRYKPEKINESFLRSLI